jgi:hypothetical protein
VVVIVSAMTATTAAMEITGRSVCICASLDLAGANQGRRAMHTLTGTLVRTQRINLCAVVSTSKVGRRRAG